jgi:hypothetical protein
MRRANARPSGKPGLLVQLMAHEERRLKINPTQGGAQDLENWCKRNIDQRTLTLFLDPIHRDRIERICIGYGPGGPNNRLRGVFIPAFRRHGIDLLPKWRTPPPIVADYEARRCMVCGGNRAHFGFPDNAWACDQHWRQVTGWFA